MDGGPSEVYASSGAAVFVRDEPQGHTMQDACSMLMEPHGYEEECLMLIARDLLGLLLMGTQGHE